MFPSILEFLTRDANDASELLLHASLYVFMVFLGRCLVKKAIYREIPILKTGAPNGSVPQNICSSCKFLLAGRCGEIIVLGRKVLLGKR